MDAATLVKCMPGLTLARAKTEIDGCNQALQLAGCTTVNRAAMFLAQVGTESMSLRYTEEIASGAAYNGRADLGNTQPGDGPRFKGRSYIQITGRTHYTNLSKWAHGKGLVPNATYFVTNPAQLASAKYRWIGPVWYWVTQRPMNSYADKGDIRGGTIAVNGGTNGLADRTSRWNRCRNLGNAILPTATAAVKPAVKAAVATVAKITTTKKGTPVPTAGVAAGNKQRLKWRTLASPGQYPGGACSCMTQSIPLVEALLIERGVIKQSLDFWQGGYCGGVAASAGTHNGGGVIDTKQTDDAVVQALRECGWAAWYRGPGAKYGNFTTRHIHAVMIGCPHVSGGAASQVTAYRGGRNGLANGAADYHPRPTIRTFSQALTALTKTTSGSTASVATPQEGVPVMAKPKKWNRTKARKIAKSKVYKTVPLTNDNKTYSMAAGPGTVYATVDIVTDKDCWARFVTVNKNGSKVKYATRYTRVKIKAGGDQLVLWDTIGGPGKGYKQKLVRVQVLAYSSPVTVKSMRTRAAKEK